MLRTVLAVLVALSLACGSLQPDHVAVDMGAGNIVTPGSSHEWASTFAAALGCDPASLTWSIQEAGNAGFVSPRDGAISAAGAFTAPSCGSIYVGGIEHVQATGCGRTGVATIAIAQELLEGVAFAFAVLNPGTAVACLAPDPTTVSVPIGGQVQFYARLHFTCQDVIVPTPPATWPPLCP